MPIATIILPLSGVGHRLLNQTATVFGNQTDGRSCQLLLPENIIRKKCNPKREAMLQRTGGEWDSRISDNGLSFSRV